MDGNDRLVIADSSIDKPGYNLVALGVQAAISAWLGHATRELPITQIMIRSDADFLGANNFCVRRILPIHMKLPNQDRIVLHYLLQLRAARSHDDIRRTLRRN